MKWSRRVLIKFLDTLPLSQFKKLLSGKMRYVIEKIRLKTKKARVG